MARHRVVVLTFDPEALDRLWLARYAPELIPAERARYPTIARIADVVGGRTSVIDVPITHDCTDGFTEAFFARPEAFLDANVRGSQSAWSFIDDDVEATSMARLSEDLASGEWELRYGDLRVRPFYEGSLRLVVSDRG